MILNVLAVLVVALIVTIFQGDGAQVINGISVVLISGGIFFFVGTSIGLLRFPDFYSRMHAAGKGDTLSSVLILMGAVVYTLGHGHLELTVILVGVKLLMIANFIFIGSPTATHAIMDAGYETEVDHWEKKRKS